MHDADHLGVGLARDRHPGRGVHDDDVVIARVDPRRWQQEEGRRVLIAVEAGLELEIAEQFEMAQVRRDVFERRGPVLDQAGVQGTQADRAQEADDIVPRHRHGDLVADPVQRAAQAAADGRLAHVDLIEEAVEREQLDVARLRRKQPGASLAPLQLAISPRGLDQQRQVVPLGRQRAHQLAGEVEDAALVVGLAQRFGDDEDVLLHARFSRSSGNCAAGGSTMTVEAMRP